MADLLIGERLCTHLEKKEVEAKLAGDMCEASVRREMCRIMQKAHPDRVAKITRIPFLKRLERTGLTPQKDKANG